MYNPPTKLLSIVSVCVCVCVCGVCVCVCVVCMYSFVCVHLKHSLHHCILISRTCFKKISAGLELAIQQVRMRMSRVVDVFQTPPVCCDFPFSQCPLQQLAISSQAQSFIDTKQIVSTGPFIFAQLEEVRTINLYCCIWCFSHMLCLPLLPR